MEKDNSVSVHHKNLPALATKIYKVSNSMSPTTLNDIFESRATPYNVRNPVSFKIRKVFSVHNGTQTPSHLGPKIWSLMLQEIRQSVSIGDFKSKVKKWLHLIVSADYEKIIYIKSDSFERTYSHKSGSCFYCYQTYF